MDRSLTRETAQNEDSNHPHNAPPHRRTRGILLVNVGTPDAPEPPAVRRYLAEFLADPAVIQLPLAMRWMQKPLAHFIAWRRAHASAEKYQQIWTDRGSPLRAIMEDQADELGKVLPSDWRVFLGMRYGNPSIPAALRSIAAAGIDELVVVPVYPQFSQTTTGTVLDEVYRVLKQHGLHINVSARTTWFDDAGYLNSQAHLLATFARSRELNPGNSYLVFSAHGLPVSYVRRGDPYEKQINHTVRLVAERLGWPAERYQLAYQSRMGPAEWLGPDIVHVLPELAQRGEKQVVVCPVSFVVDCLETLEEIHIRARDEFAAAGGELYVAPALNTDARFINCLKNLAMRGAQPVVDWKKGHRPLFNAKDIATRATTDTNLAQLVMVGVTMGNRVGSGRGPKLNYSAEADFACAKKPHGETQTLLKALREHPRVSEAFIWNTCFRFECYAWLKPGQSGEERSCAVAELRDSIFGEVAEQSGINVLFGRDAWYHLMRTIAGLNSGLPGDKDIVEQFRNAFELSQRCHAAGAHATALVNEATRLAESVRAETSWGRLDPGYCYAALTRVAPQLPAKPANLTHVVIGGSTTSRSILETLYNQFGVKAPTVTLVYRTHQGGQMKLLRRAVGNGRRLRVAKYSEKSVLEAVADADVVHFGIDRADPILTAENLTGLRDFEARPMAILDFNSSGSTRDVAQVPGVTLVDAKHLDSEVETFADEMCAQDEFPQIVQEAEAWIEQRLPKSVTPNIELPCEPKTGDPSACVRCGGHVAGELTRSATQ